MDCSPPGSSVYGTFQTRILEWVVISSSRGSSWSRDQTCISCIGRWIFYHLSHLGSLRKYTKGTNLTALSLVQSIWWSGWNTGNFFYVNIGCCKQIGEGVPGERESSMTSFWSKTFCDLSLATVLALEQVSVIHDLKGSDGMLEQRKGYQETIVQW